MKPRRFHKSCSSRYARNRFVFDRTVEGLGLVPLTFFNSGMGLCVCEGMFYRDWYSGIHGWTILPCYGKGCCLTTHSGPKKSVLYYKHLGSSYDEHSLPDDCSVDVQVGHRNFHIPPGFALHVAISGGRVKEYLLIPTKMEFIR